jgi:hypothetical protein
VEAIALALAESPKSGLLTAGTFTHKAGPIISKMSSGVPSVEGEPPRKRVRKGTRSCWECRTSTRNPGLF